jgi:hypothetical protein
VISWFKVLLSDATCTATHSVALAGFKASACARLSALAADPNAGFQAPPGAVLPFGSMEAAAAAVVGRYKLNPVDP